MTRLPQAIRVEDLHHDTDTVLKRIQSSSQPLVVIQRGRAVAVLLSVAAYERGEPERQLLRALVRGEQEITAGAGYDLDDVLADADTDLVHGHL